MNTTVKYNEDVEVEWFTVQDQTPKVKFEMQGSTAVLSKISAGDYDGEVYGFEISMAMNYARKMPFVQAVTIKEEPDE